MINSTLKIVVSEVSADGITLSTYMEAVAEYEARRGRFVVNFKAIDGDGNVSEETLAPHPGTFDFMAEVAIGRIATAVKEIKKRYLKP